MLKMLPVLLLTLFIISCNRSTDDAASQAVARVNDSYLMRDSIVGIVPPGSSKEDSVLFVRSFIDRWARQKLLLKGAEVNLNKTKKAGLDLLVRQYKNDLYTKAYIEDLVTANVDSLISDYELKAYYQENKLNFLTNGTLVRLRYIHLQKDNPRLENIRNRFFDFRKSGRKFWENYALQFKSFAFNDSVWVDIGQVYSRLPFINPNNRDHFIVPGRSIQQPDSTDVYLVKILGVIQPNQVSPFEYLKPTLREVILNRRKLALIKKFEKEITDDALKNKTYEIYK
jgi:hypothetical protein